MKALKKVLALCLAAILLLALCPAAFADGETANVTIKGAAYGETYNFYKMFSVKSVATEGEKTLISYEVTDGWRDFFETGAGNQYITLENGNPTWTGESTAAAYEAFAKAAFAYVGERSLTADKTAIFNGPEDKIGQTGDFAVNDLPLGYYLVDTSLGALLSLGSAHTNVEIQEKNDVPTFTKKVQDSAGNWGASNTAKIGDTVNFESEFTIGKGNDYDYFFKDTMFDGLTLDNSTIKVQVRPKDGTLSDVTKSETTYTDLTKGEADTFTFGLKFAQAFIEQYREGTVVITYSAVLNEKAKIDDANPNPNDATLTYNNKTLKGHTDTYTYQFDLVKYYTDANGEKKLLKDAEFKLFENADGSGDAIKFVKNETDTEYRVAKQGETGATDTIVTLGTEKINIKGLDKKTYYLEETKAPGGYNKLKQRVTVNLTNGSLKAAADTFTDGVQVENKSGTTLPSTGGMGTTLFYVVGGLLMVCAVVLLVTKKRMEKNA